MPKLIAEWFLTDRWMGSSGFLLPMAARGLYREMLTQAWRRGAKLPNNHEAIRRAVGATRSEWTRLWPLVSHYWSAQGSDLVNETQVEVYGAAMAKAEAYAERSRKGGKASAQVRLKLKSGSTQVEPKLVLKGVLGVNTPSPSPSITTLVSNLQRNALVDRPKLEAEWGVLIPRVAEAANLDPTEVARKVTDFRGYGYVNAATMSDDRLAQSMINLRKWDREIRGVPEPVMLKVAGRAPPTDQPIDPAAQAIVVRLLAYLEPKVDTHWFHMWFRDWTGIGLDGGALRIGVQSEEIAGWLPTKHGELLQEAATAVGHPGLRIKFEVG